MTQNKPCRSTKRHWVMIMLGLFLMIFLFGNVAAAQWDNIKSYDPSTNTVTFSNSFLKIIPLDSFGNATLETPQINKVPIGNDILVAQFTISTQVNYLDILGSFELIDLNTGKQITRNLTIKYLTYEQIDIEDFSPIFDKNGTIKDYVVNGSHKEQREKWQSWDKNVMQNKAVIVGIFTDVDVGDHVEWIPTIAGVKVVEWAEWVASIDVGLTHWYKLGLNFSDSTKLNNGTNSGSTNITGRYVINGDGLGKYFDGASYYVSLDIAEDYTPAIAYSFWIYPNRTNATGDGDVIFSKPTTGGAIMEWISLVGDEVKYWYDGTATGQSRFTTDSADLQNNQWYHIIVNGTGDAADYTIWVNGVNQSITKVDGGSRPTGTPTANYIGGDELDLNKFTQGIIDEFGIWNRTITTTEVGILYNEGFGCTYQLCNATIVDELSVVLLSPTNHTNFTTSTNYFVSNVTNSSLGITITNVSLLINGTVNQTNTSGILGVYNFSLSTGEGFYNWSVRAFGNDSIQYNASNGTLDFTIDTTPPNVSNNNITNLFTTSMPVNLTWNYSATDTHLSVCYYNTTENPTYTNVTCNSPIITTFSLTGNKTIQYCANDTFGFESCGTGYSFITLANISQADNPDPTGEGGRVTFNLSINTSSIPTTTATLFLNNTVFSPTTAVAGTNGYYFAVDVDIPLGWGLTTGNNVSWFWNYTISGLVTNSTTNSTNLTVYSLRMDNCSSFTNVIFNMTLYDEGNATLINTTLGSNIQLDVTLTGLENSSITQEFNGTYNGTTSAAVCVPINLINNTEYKIDIVGEYSATTHVVEFFYLDNGTLNSSSFLDSLTNKTVNVYDLLSADSTTFLFSFLDEDNIEVPNAIVHVFRQYIGEGVFREVERGKQDNNGQTHLHLVEEDVIYFFRISLDGELLFTSTTYNAKCLSSPCEIELSASIGTPQFDTNFTGVDGSFEITTFPAQRTVMLQFALNDVSTMNLTLVSQDYTGNFTQVNTTSVTSTGSSLNLTIPQAAGNVTFYAIVYKDGEFVSYKILNLQQRGSDYFGTTGLIMAAFMVLALVLMAIFEGAGVIVFLILALAIAGAMGVLDLGYYSLIGLICALMILIFKLVQKRR